jgi:hypothetical protein
MIRDLCSNTWRTKPTHKGTSTKKHENLEGATLPQSLKDLLPTNTSIKYKTNAAKYQ